MMIADLRFRIADWWQRGVCVCAKAFNPTPLRSGDNSPQSTIRNPQWLVGRRGDMAEGALTFPLMALVTLALVNLALAGFSATTANHAAGYGARAGSVAQADPAGRALEAAQQALRSGIGDYAVRVAADTYPGGVVRVEVDWAVPNFYGSLMPLFGASSGPLKGTAVSAFRKEGW